VSDTAPLQTTRAFLFSVDLEDVRSMIPGGERYAPRVAANVERYLEVLGRHGARSMRSRAPRRSPCAVFGHR
jgi:hypothetical protein